MHKVFVYGTLKKGHGNHERLLASNSKFIGNACTEPIFTMLHLGGFPGIVLGGHTPIKGELFEVDAETLARLDHLEGHPNFYQRVPVATTLEDGTLIPAEGYVLPEKWLGDERIKTIPSGVWGEAR